ncbi:putative wxcM-like protein, partial [Bacteroides fragilis str. 3783N1-2]
MISHQVQSAWFLHPMSIRRLIILGIMKIFWNLGIRNKGSSSNLVVNFL